MKVLIEEYVEMRQQLFPHANLRPKHHYLLHYADLTLQFGPLIHTWTMRFESKHIAISKGASGQVGKSLAHRHQLFQAFQSSGNLFSQKVQVSDSTSFYPELYDSSIREAVADFGLTSVN